MLSTHERGAFTYAYPHPAVAADIAIFTLRDGQLALLLIARGEDPHKGMWALPGGFLRPNEDLDACARRELFEETGVAAPVLRQFAVFSAPGRDPREWVLSVAYLALLRSDHVSPVAGTDAAATQWFGVTTLPPLAFDHAQIVEAAVSALRSLIDSSDILLGLMPKRFTLSQFQAAHEAVAGAPVDKRNFRARVLMAGRLRETADMERGAHRPARLYERA